ncbi:UNVERIFIED_CONTAM: hypothetical protein HDU68_004734 [Siphonaria sp. JEL0065]|nr:hypothetical protein HDU68_004734 [Siphonaria sp. JEL0065]
MTSLACCSGTVAPEPSTPFAGHEETIASHACYVSQPKNRAVPLSSVIIASDIFGYKLINARLIADKFAEAGYLAVILDLFKGSEPPANLMTSIETLTSQKASFFSKMYAFGRILWYMPGFIWRNPFKKGVTILEEVIGELKEKRRVGKVAVQGYCWGGTLSVYLAQKPNSVDAVCAAHPGSLTFPSDIEKIQKPIYFVLPSKDHSIKPPQRKIIEDVLTKKDKTLEGGLLHQVEWFEGAEHGFAVRGNESDPVIAAMRQTAFNNAVSFFGDVFSY